MRANRGREEIATEPDVEVKAVGHGAKGIQVGAVKKTKQAKRDR